MRIIGILLLAILSLLEIKAQDVFTSSPNQAILFNTNLYDIPVNGIPVLMNSSYGLERICINLTHVNLTDIKVSVVSPAGTEILLTNKNGVFGDSYTNTCFTGNSSDPAISSGSGTFTGDFFPEEQLGKFNLGIENPNGTWQLKIIDDISFFDGTLISFELTFSNNPAVIPSAPNDECAQAIAIILNANYNCSNKTTGNIVDANPSQNIPQCNIPILNFDDDIWFSFATNATAQDFEITNIIGTSTELIYQILEGNCQSLTEVYCDEGTDNIFSVNNLIAGNQYFLRIASKTENPNQNISFDICIKEGIPDPPLNDECLGAIEIPNSGVCEQVAGSIAGATASSQSQSCPGAGSFSNDVWFFFVANQASMQVKVSDIEGVTRDLDFQISHGLCTNPAQDFCFFEASPGTDIFIPLNNLTINETYYIRIASFNDAPKNTSFNICLENPPPPPPNDECAGAINLVPDATNCTLTSGTLFGATGTASGFNCDAGFEDYFDDDVWFKFSATETAHSINIFNISGSSNDLIYEVLSGTCGNLTSVQCQDDPNAQINLDQLTIGQTYYIRIASYFDLVQNTTFDICVGNNNLLVTNTLSSGEGSLRFAVDNASAEDTVRFALNLNGSTILLSAPSIIVDNELVFHNDYGNNVKIGNSNPGNTDFLITIQDKLDIKGLQLLGTSPAAMKIKVEATGHLKIYEE